MSNFPDINIRPAGKTVEEILRKSSQTVADSLERLYTGLPVGQVTTAIGDSFFGLNHRQQPGAIPINKDYYGLTFFTRPRLNLTADNIRAVRLLTPLLTNEPASIQRIIRCLLSPDLAAEGITSPFVDRQQAFIPVLTNHLLSLNGWPDITAPTMTSQEGVYKEAFSMVDGLTTNYGVFPLTANFRNLPGDPISALILFWLHYMSHVYQGTLVPYPDMIIQNEIDYQTRIYRLVLDSNKRRVQKIGACGAAFPISLPTGAAFNFESDRPINNSNDQITVQFQAIGAMYQDDILIDEFNRTVALFNDLMSERYFSGTVTRGDGGQTIVNWTNPFYVQVPMDALGIFNNRGYPRIDPTSYELQWWVSQEAYLERLPAYRDQLQLRETPAGQPRGQ